MNKPEYPARHLRGTKAGGMRLSISAGREIRPASSSAEIPIEEGVEVSTFFRPRILFADGLVDGAGAELPKIRAR